MSTLYRYLLALFFSMFCIVALGLTGIFVLVDAFEHLDEFIEAKVPVGTVGLYFLLKLPGIFYQLSPLILLLSGLLAMAMLSRHAELMALKCIGVRPRQVMAPVLLAALGLSGATFLAKAFYIPKAAAKSQEIWNIEVKHQRPKGVMKEGRLVYHGKDCIWTTGLGSPDARVLKDVWWVRFDGDYTARRILSAPEAVYEKDRGWVFRNGIQIVKAGDRDYTSNTFDTLALQGVETPEDFVSVEIPPRAMDLPALWRNVARLKEAGASAHQQETVLWNAIFYPFLGTSLLALGLPLILSATRWGIGPGLGLGVVMGFGAWSLWSFMLTLGNAGTLPGPLPPLCIHGLLLGAGAVTLRKTWF